MQRSISSAGPTSGAAWGCSNQPWIRCQSTPPHGLCSDLHGGPDTPVPSAGSGGISGSAPPELDESSSASVVCVSAGAVDEPSELAPSVVSLVPTSPLSAAVVVAAPSPH